MVQEELVYEIKRFLKNVFVCFWQNLRVLIKNKKIWNFSYKF